MTIEKSPPSSSSARRRLTRILLLTKILKIEYIDGRSSYQLDFTRLLVILFGISFVSGEHFIDAKKWLGFDRCGVRNADGSPSWWPLMGQGRPCLEGQATFVRYTNPTNYPFIKDARVLSKPNRTLFVNGIRKDGTIVWQESVLLDSDPPSPTSPNAELPPPTFVWKTDQKAVWVQVNGGDEIPTTQALGIAEAERIVKTAVTGFILRRVIVDGDGHCPDSKPAPLNGLEFYILNPFNRGGKSIHDVGIYERDYPMTCGDQFGTSLRVGEHFHLHAKSFLDAIEVD